jgi:hypothetical protein
MIARNHLGPFAVVLLCAAWLQAQAASDAPNGGLADADKEPWSFSFTTTGYIVPHDRSYASPTFSADRQRLHLEVRYNYEDQETGSLWLGYNLSVGEKLVFEATPMLGGVFGRTTGIAPGFGISLTYKKFELSSEGEYVFDTGNRSSNFFYSWNEFTYSPREWFHTGLVSQRTRAYQTKLDVQRGVLFGFSHKKIDFTTYILNAGWTDPTFVLSLGFNF